MAGFKTHISFSTALGVGYGSIAAVGYDVDPVACILAGGLCSLSGMLPDLDSDSGTPLREAVQFTSAVAPMMLLHRFQQMHLSHEMMILATAGVYALIRFGVARVLGKLTVHRGMFHSIPALVIAAEVAFLVIDTGELWERYFMAGGVALGFFSHLLLDEIWSVEMHRGRVRLKSSFGTAIKFWGDSMWPNLLTYGLAGFLSFVLVNDPRWMDQVERMGEQAVDHVANMPWEEEQDPPGRATIRLPR